jgi:hypothetical protein
LPDVPKGFRQFLRSARLGARRKPYLDARRAEKIPILEFR